MKKLLAASALALATLTVAPAQATIIDHGDYLTDTATGLDWLDVTKSVNMSFSYVSSQFGAGGLFAGWRYATGDEFNGLVGSYTGTTPTTYNTVTQERDKIDGLVDLLGSTLDAYMVSAYGKTWDSYSGYSEGRGRDFTYGFTADVVAWAPTARHFAILIDDDRNEYMTDQSAARNGFAGGAYRDGYTGSYLVRSSAPTNTNNVPEPSTVALLGLGLLGFAASRRKAKSK